jgi:hypothetical protein
LVMVMTRSIVGHVTLGVIIGTSSVIQ